MSAPRVPMAKSHADPVGSQFAWQRRLRSCNFKTGVMLRCVSRGRDSLCGKNHQNRSHSERSAARAKVGRHGVEESRECSQEVRTRPDVVQAFHGVLHCASAHRQSPRRRSAQNDLVFWGRFIGSGVPPWAKAEAERSRSIPWRHRRRPGVRLASRGILRLRAAPPSPARRLLRITSDFVIQPDKQAKH